MATAGDKRLAGEPKVCPAPQVIATASRAMEANLMAKAAKYHVNEQVEGTVLHSLPLPGRIPQEKNSIKIWLDGMSPFHRLMPVSHGGSCMPFPLYIHHVPQSQTVCHRE